MGGRSIRQGRAFIAGQNAASARSAGLREKFPKSRGGGKIGNSEKLVWKRSAGSIGPHRNYKNGKSVDP